MFWFKKQDEIKAPVIAEYIWIDTDGINMKSKHQTLDILEVKSIRDIPYWSSNNIILKPIYYCKDPFRKNPNAILVLCTTWKWSINEGSDIKPDFFSGLEQKNLNEQYLEPALGNFRTPSEAIWTYVEEDEICFGIEQQYLIEDHTQQLDKPQQCSLGRKVSETHYQYCLYAGLNINSVNSQVISYQIGVCLGIEICDQLWISRYILYRVAEQFGVNINLQPKPDLVSVGKPLLPECNGNLLLEPIQEGIDGNSISEISQSAHITFSTAITRLEARKAEQQKPNNLGVILQQMINDLGSTHQQYIQYFGKDNKQRLLGINETSNYDSFSYGIDSCNVSIKIPTKPIKHKVTSYRTIQGYLEDRRPGANMDPYIVCALIAQSILAPNLPQLTGSLLQAYQSNK